MRREEGEGMVVEVVVVSAECFTSHLTLEVFKGVKKKREG